MSIPAALQSKKMTAIPSLAFSTIMLAWLTGTDTLFAGGASDREPRKVIVGTAMQAFWGE